MSGLPWFRMYADAVDNDKLRLLAFEDRWHYVALLCLKSQGVLDGRNEDLRRKAISIKLGLDSVELETVMKRLVTVGLVTPKWQPVNWAERQFKSDSSTSRVRAFRKRFGNVSETDQIQNRTETDTEKRSAGALILHESLPKEAWEEWLTRRREKRWPVDATTLRKQLALLAKYPTDTQREIIDTSLNAGWQGLFHPKGRPAATHADTEAAALSKMMARRAAIGLADFRDPHPGENSKAYDAAQTAALAERKRAPVPNFAGMVKRV